MPNFLSKFIASFIALGVLFVFPTFQSYKAQERMAALSADIAVHKFVDNVRMKGFITAEMIEDFQRQLHIGDVLYDVEMVHRHKIYTPVYTNTSDLNSYTGEYTVDNDDFYGAQIMDYLFGDSGSGPIELRMYKLEKDDYFEVSVENKTKFKSTMLFDFITLNPPSDNEVVVSIPYGGMVLNEDY